MFHCLFLLSFSKLTVAHKFLSSYWLIHFFVLFSFCFLFCFVFFMCFFSLKSQSMRKFNTPKKKKKNIYIYIYIYIYTSIFYALPSSFFHSLSFPLQDWQPKHLGFLPRYFSWGLFFLLLFLLFLHLFFLHLVFPFLFFLHLLLLPVRLRHWALKQRGMSGVVTPGERSGCNVRIASIEVVADVLEPVLVRCWCSICLIRSRSASRGKNWTRNWCSLLWEPFRGRPRRSILIYQVWFRSFL